MALKRYAYSELHVSTTSGFTPSAATLAAVSKSGTFSPANLTPGTTYYYRILHRDLRGLVGQATAEQSFVAGYTQLGHIDPALRQDMFAYLSADVKFFNTASQYAVPLDTSTLDPQSNWDASVHGFRASSAGWFQVQGIITISKSLTLGDGAVTPGDIAFASILKNGSINVGSGPSAGVLSAANSVPPVDGITLFASATVQLAINDYLQLAIVPTPATLNVNWGVIRYVPNSVGQGTSMSVVQLLS